MSIATQHPGTLSPYPIYRLTVERYHQMIRAGIIDEDDGVELLEGCVVPRMGHNPPHDTSLLLAEEEVRPRLPTGWIIRIQCPVTTADSEPEPDLTIARGNKRTFATRHPEATDIGFLIEVSEATLQHDRQHKGRIYARAQIAAYWIINLIDRQVEVYTDPTGSDANPRYLQRQDCDVNSAVPLVLDGQSFGSIPVRELLP
jgi:hypothetical protein